MASSTGFCPGLNTSDQTSKLTKQIPVVCKPCGILFTFRKKGNQNSWRKKHTPQAATGNKCSGLGPALQANATQAFNHPPQHRWLTDLTPFVCFGWTNLDLNFNFQVKELNNKTLKVSDLSPLGMMVSNSFSFYFPMVPFKLRLCTISVLHLVNNIFSQ